MPKAAAAAAGTPDKVTLNFYLPHSIEFQGQKARARRFQAPAGSLRPLTRARRRACAQVDQVSIPAVTGEFGVLPGHVPTVAQLKPGVLAVHLEADKNVKKARAAHRGRTTAARAARRRAGRSRDAARRQPGANAATLGA